MIQEKKAIRLSKAAREFNVGISTILEFLHKKGVNIDTNPNTKVPPDVYELLEEEFSSDISLKKESEKLSLKNLREVKETISIADIEEKESHEISEPEEEVFIKDTSGIPATSEVIPAEVESETKEDSEVKVIKKIDLDVQKTKEKPKKEKSEKLDTVQNDKPEEKIAEEIPEKEPEITAKEEIAPDTLPKKPELKKGTDIKEKKLPESEKQVIAQEEVLPEQVETEPEIEKPEQEISEEIYRSDVLKLSGPTVVGKIDLPVKEEKKKPVASSSNQETIKKKRKRIRKETGKVTLEQESVKKSEKQKEKELRKPVKTKRRIIHQEIDEEDVQKQIKETLARLTTKGKSKGAKYRKEKKEAIIQRKKADVEKSEKEKNILKVTEFVSVNELATMMNAPVNDVISTCMNLGLLVSINQRLDAETMELVAEEFGFDVNFVSIELQESIKEEEDPEGDLLPRPPIVTVMGHVDHGKTKLLDYIRKTNVIAGEAGGITQHIGAYSVSLQNGRQITFLDTPGHEAFTAMRARGAQITDVVIVVIAADDGVMPQTIEAINHAHAAGVPIVFAINKIDKPTSNPEKIKEELAKINFLVEDWGGKYQCQEISAKNGINIDELLEKVLLEAEMLELKANPKRKANGTVIESSLDKGKGYIVTILIKTGILKVGDMVLAGSHHGHVKVMYNERGKIIDMAGPSTPILILGLNGAPQAGDNFNVMEHDREAKEIATKREQLKREQELRTQKHITLDEIGRRIAIGNFQELNIIVKGDVDGSVEALTDSLEKLSTEEIQLNIIHKAVGQISESDVLLAVASNAIIVGFQVRPSMVARKLAEKEEIDIRLYSIIYDAIEEIKSAMEGMLSPEIKEETTATLEIQEIFKISKIGTIAGCIVKEGKIMRDSKVRIIREGIVKYAGELGSLKRFKEDVKEVYSGLECGLNIENFNDVKVGDIIEAYKEIKVKKLL
jgi:translation initiation factor IF-2